MSYAAIALQSGSSLLDNVTNFLVSLGTAARDQADMDRRVREMHKLHALSDVELETRGIKRERIAHHVFRDIYYV